MSGLRGTLEGISLADVLELLHAHGRSGMLQVHTAASRGVLHLQAGRLIHAETLGAQGEPAALDMLGWTEGGFEFIPVLGPAPHSIHRAMPDLLMHAARLEDSRRRVAEVIPDPTSIPWPRRSREAQDQPPLLSLDTLRLLPFMDGCRDFFEVAQAAECHEVEVRHAAALLRQAGHLELLRPHRTLRVVPRRGRFFQRGAHLEVAAALEGPWRALEPYQGGVGRLRVDLPRGPATEALRFSAQLPERALALPTELMVAWDLKEGDAVTVRPLP